jgi:glycerate dehydrogenase
MPVKIVVLDGQALNPGDLGWDNLRALGEVEIYDNSGASDVVERGRGAAVLLTNKTPVGAYAIAELPELRMIGVLATGYDIIDVPAASKHGVIVSNIPAYGTNSVAQFTFALLLELCHRVQMHSDDVSAGGWTRRNVWSYHVTPLIELAGKTMGLIGLGRIGQQVSVLARAFGMEVIATSPQAAGQVPLEDLLRRSDVVSLHCPLTPETRGIINAERLHLMKRTAFLINTSRGGLMDEAALAEALHTGVIAGAATDVLPTEPPAGPSPLMTAPNCIVTPHIAWATREARARLMQTAIENVRAFLEGTPANAVNSIATPR